MLAFALAVTLLLATPGPGVVSLAGVGSAFGRGAGLRYLAGLFLGTNAVALAVISGLAALVLAEPALRWALFAASTAYLLWLAFRIATAETALAIRPAARAPGIRGGLALQALNPKAYVVNAALFAGFPLLPGRPVAEVAAKLAVVNAIWLAVHAAWLLAGIALRRADLPARARRWINRAMAAAMIGVVGLAAASAIRG